MDTVLLESGESNRLEATVLQDLATLTSLELMQYFRPGLTH